MNTYVEPGHCWEFETSLGAHMENVWNIPSEECVHVGVFTMGSGVECW